MRRALVVGGSGFIGSHLCEALLIRGDWVVCVDDFSLGTMEGGLFFRGGSSQDCAGKYIPGGKQ